MSAPTRTHYQGESPAESSHAPLNFTLAHSVDAAGSGSFPLSLHSPPRVNQIDAEDLNSALVSMLSEKLGRSLENFKSSLSIGLKPELELVIKLLLFRYGVWDPLIRSSPGAKLQNLKLVSGTHRIITRKTLLLYAILHPPIFPTYLITRIREHALSNQWPDLPNHDWRKKAWRALGRVENVSRIWELVGWVWFLLDGKYPSLLMRILRLRLVASQSHLTRLVSYEFMNRQLVWGTFTEFLMFSVPLLSPMSTYLDYSSIISPIKTLLSPPVLVDYKSISLQPMSSGSNSGNKVKKHSGPYAGLPRSTCPICYIRFSSAPVPLESSTSQGAALTLPPIPHNPHSESSGLNDGRDTDSVSEFEHNEKEGDEESRIFVPAQTNCEGGCKWCYYCIGEELNKHRELVQSRGSSQGQKQKSKSRVGKIDEGASKEKSKHGRSGDAAGEGNVVDEETKWNCLRCGGGATRAWRVGAEE